MPFIAIFSNSVASAPTARPSCGLAPPRVAECDGVRGWCGVLLHGACVLPQGAVVRACGAVRVWCYYSMCDGGARGGGVDHVAKGEGARLWNVHVDGMDGGGTAINTTPGFSSEHI
nr:hypothetical protein Iba_chr05bCG7610 [Ipomoea batatas]